VNALYLKYYEEIDMPARSAAATNQHAILIDNINDTVINCNQIQGLRFN
jgi:hypothetical protein